MNKLNNTLRMLHASGRAIAVVTVLLGGLVTIILLALLYRSHITFERELTATFQRHQLTTARSLATGVEEVFAEVEDDLRGLARHEGIASEPSGHQEYIHAYYETHTDILNNITVVDAGGERIFRSPKAAKKHNVSQWPEFLSAKDTRKPWIGKPTKCVIDTTQTVVRIFVPVVENGQFNGAIYAGINLKKLWAKCMKRPETGHKSLCWVVEDYGELLHHANSEYVGLKWEQIEDKWRSSGKGAGVEIDEDIEELAHRVRKRVQDGQEGTAEYVNCLEGVEELVAFTPIRLGNERYGLAVVTPKSEISAPIAHQEMVTYALMAGLAVLCVAGGYAVYRGGRARILLAEERKHADALRKSESKYRDLFASMPSGFAHCRIVLDDGGKPVDFVYLEVNGAFERLTGLRRDDVLGKRVTEAIPGIKEAHPELFEIYSDAALTGTEKTFDIHFQPLDIWLSIVVYSPARGEFVAVFENITERKQTEEALRESEGKLLAFMESATEGFVVYDSDLNLSSINKTALQIFPAGSTAENLRGKHILDIAPGLKKTGRYDEYVKVVKTGEPLYFHDIVPDSQFGDRRLSLNAFRVGGGLGIIFTDITERKRAEEEIANLAKFPSENPYPVIRIAADGEVLYANAGALGLLEDLESGLGKPAPEQWRRIVAEVLQTGSIRRIEAEHRGRVFAFRAVPVPDAGYVNWYGVDITERKRAEEDKENLARFPAENPYPVLRIAAEGEVMYANTAALGLLEDLESGPGKPAPEHWRRIVTEVLQSGSIRRVEAEHREKVFAFRAVPVADGRYVNWYGVDITERKQVEEVAQNLAKFPAENPGPVLRIAGDGNIIFANKAAQPLLDAWSCQVNQALPKQWAELVAHVLVTGPREDVQIKCDGRMFLVTFAPVVEAGYVNLYGRDITERKRMQDEQRIQSEITANMSEGVYLVRLDDGVIIYTNPRFEEMFGYSPGEMTGKHVSIVNAPTEKTAEETAAEIIAFLDKHGSWRGEVNNIKKDGTPFWCYASVSMFDHPEHGRVLVSAHTDITDRKQADEDVRRSHEQLRALAGRLQDVREEERIRLARMIHDEVGHNLTALKMDLAWMNRRLPKAACASPTSEIRERLEAMSKLLTETIQKARETASELRPGLLDDVGLDAAIEWEARQFQRRTGVECTFTGNAEELELDRDQSTALFRICQGLLTNIASHAGATAATIALKRQGDELVLEVSDDGMGIREKQISSSRSLGILGMRERALVLGGRFSISGRDGKGTTATVRIPLGTVQARGE